MLTKLKLFVLVSARYLYPYPLGFPIRLAISDAGRVLPGTAGAIFLFFTQ